MTCIETRLSQGSNIVVQSGYSNQLVGTSLYITCCPVVNCFSAVTLVKKAEMDIFKHTQVEKLRPKCLCLGPESIGVCMRRQQIKQLKVFIRFALYNNLTSLKSVCKPERGKEADELPESTILQS